MAAPKRAAKAAKATVERQRSIQAATDHDEERMTASRKSTPKTDKPKHPLPAQHQQKPGSEQQLDPRPQFMAPNYTGSGKLAGMSTLITGGDSGIGRAVAVLFAREGADVLPVMGGPTS